MFYLPQEEINGTGTSVVIRGEQAKHLTRSLRVRSGDTFILGDGAGSKYKATVTGIGHSELEAGIDLIEKSDRRKPAIVLFQAVTQAPKMDTVIARSAEAGIDTVVPFVSKRSEKGRSLRSFERFERWQRIAVEASKVARLAWPLEVREVLDWESVVGEIDRQQLNLVLWEEETRKHLAEVLPDAPPSSIGMIVGPEGGFSRDDVGVLCGKGCLPVSLGGIILRAESAGSYVAMLIRYHYGLLKPGGS